MYVPGVGGAWKSNLNSNVSPGATVPVTLAGRSSASHVESAKTLARFSGWVVAKRVWLSQAFVPVFLSVIETGSVWQVVMLRAVVARGQLWLTYAAPYVPAVAVPLPRGVV